MATYRQLGKMAQPTSLPTFFPPLEILQRLVLKDTGFVFDPVTGKTYAISSAGLFILQQIQKGATLNQIIQNISREFQITTDIAERDVREFGFSLQSLLK